MFTNVVQFTVSPGLPAYGYDPTFCWGTRVPGSDTPIPSLEPSLRIDGLKHGSGSDGSTDSLGQPDHTEQWDNGTRKVTPQDG